MAVNMSWSHIFTKSSDRYYFGNDPQVNRSARGFVIKNNGVWMTSVFRDEKKCGAQIFEGAIAWIGNEFGFQADIHPDGDKVMISVNYKGLKRCVEFYTSGEWVYGEGPDPNACKKLVHCYLRDEGNCIFVQRNDGLEGIVTHLRPNVFNVSGKFYSPRKVPQPDKIYYGVDGSDSSHRYEYIYTGLVDRGLLMLSENGRNAYYGEAYYGKPNGYGLTLLDLNSFYSFTYGKFRRTSVRVIPTLDFECQLYFNFWRYYNKDEYHVYIKNGQNYEVGMICKDGNVTFRVDTPQHDTIKIDENVENITIDYRDNIKRTYSLFKDLERQAVEQIRKQEEAKRIEEARKAEQLRKAQEEARRAEEARKVAEARRLEEQRRAEQVRKAEEARRAEEAARKQDELRRAREAQEAAEKARAEAEAEAERLRKALEEASMIKINDADSEFIQKLKRAANLKPETHLMKSRDYFDELFKMASSGHTFMNKIEVADYIVAYFGSYANKSQIPAIYDEYKKITGKWCGLPYIEEMCNRHGSGLDDALERLCRQRVKWGLMASDYVFTLGEQILSTNHEVAYKGEEALQKFLDADFMAENEAPIDGGSSIDLSNGINDAALRCQKYDDGLRMFDILDNFEFYQYEFNKKDSEGNGEKAFETFWNNLFTYFGYFAEEEQKDAIYSYYLKSVGSTFTPKDKEKLLYPKETERDEAIYGIVNEPHLKHNDFSASQKELGYVLLTARGIIAKNVEKAVLPFKK